MFVKNNRRDPVPFGRLLKPRLNLIHPNKSDRLHDDVQSIGLLVVLDGCTKFDIGNYVEM